MSGTTATGSEVVLAGRVASRASFVFGAALSFLGVLAIMVPPFTGITRRPSKGRGLSSKFFAARCEVMRR